MAGNRNSGRKALPANVHALRGNPSKKASHELTGGHGDQPQVAAEIPPCPAFLTKDAKGEWKRIAKDLQTLGLISKLDRGELAVYCQAWADWKVAREKIAALEDSGFVETTPSGYKQMSAWMQLANRAEERMRKAGNSFGLNPSARASLGAGTVTQGELFPNEQAETARKYGL
ncbi:phage terminase, small subunit, putative, P27 family [Onishia taeanensis]|uniref:Phage terminase, small subunit, putative, P27 family n=1 Tax=Onishia taeanensis TaxID=284577 RepID=A0A1G7N6E3_9GAMM|nr:phage terminase small subunit P27 family [Halomonas taeanensis]SDF69521.1 phage terminase, small subunit, putative, P27 family [Halomonas taeanensis]